MKREAAIAWLKLLGVKVPSVQPRGGWVISECPLGPWKHTNGKSAPDVFGVKNEIGDSFCNCFSCGWHGSQSDLILQMQFFNRKDFQRKYPFGDALQLIANEEEIAELEGLNSPGIEEMLFGKKAGLHEFPEWWLASFPPWSHAPFACQYLGERGVSASVADALDVRVDPTESRVCFPVRDFKGVLRGLHGRTTDAAIEPRYRMYVQAKKNNPLIWLGESWVDTTRPVVWVEGVFDLARVYTVYRNVASPLFSNPSEEKLKRMGDVMEIVTFFDRGVGGDSGRAKVSKMMKHSVVNHVLPPKGRKDPGECSVEELREALGPYVVFDKKLI
jgi:hypothetical protein